MYGQELGESKTTSPSWSPLATSSISRLPGTTFTVRRSHVFSMIDVADISVVYDADRNRGHCQNAPAQARGDGDLGCHSRT